MVSWWLGSIVTQPIEYEPWPSKMGVQVVALSVVFQTPPEPTATYQVARSAGSIAMSAMRPDARDGPMFRKRQSREGCGGHRHRLICAVPVDPRWGWSRREGRSGDQPEGQVAQPIHTVFDRFLFIPSP